MNNYTLLSIHDEFMNYKPGISYLLKSKIRDFYNEFGIRIDTTQKRLEELKKEYFVFENDKIKMTEEPPPIPKKKLGTVGLIGFFQRIKERINPAQPPAEKPPFKPEIVFQEGKNKAEFEKKYNEIMSFEYNLAKLHAIR